MAFTQKQIDEFKVLETDAEDSYDLLSLSESILKSTNDAEWAKSILKKSEDLVEDSGDCRLLGDAYETLFNDKVSVKRLYDRAEQIAKNSNEYRFLAESIYTNLSDTTMAIAAYKKAEDITKDYKDTIKMAESVYRILKNEEWAVQLYKKAEIEANNIEDVFGWNFRDLAESICGTLGDKKWAASHYKNWESHTEELTPYCSYNSQLAVSICKNLDDKEWARNIFEMCENRAEDEDDYGDLSLMVKEHLGDETWANILLGKSEGHFHHDEKIKNDTLTQVELKFVFELESTSNNGKLWTGKCDEVYTGESWKGCCDKATDNWDYDESIFPTNKNGHVGDTAKTLQKIFQRPTEGTWEEVTGALGSEIFSYFMKTWEEKSKG